MKGTYYQMSVTSKERTEISSKQVITKISSGLCPVDGGQYREFSNNFECCLCT